MIWNERSVGAGKAETSVPLILLIVVGFFQLCSQSLAAYCLTKFTYRHRLMRNYFKCRSSTNQKQTVTSRLSVRFPVLFSVGSISFYPDFAEMLLIRTEVGRAPGVTHKMSEAVHGVRWVLWSAGCCSYLSFWQALELCSKELWDSILSLWVRVLQCRL